jgi:hypothetical protein
MVNRRFHSALAWSIACAAAVSATPISAQPSDAPAVQTEDDVRRWARGVSEAEQELARRLHAEGNAEFAESRFAQALAKYREAIRHWDHPAIRFNMAVCLINLDQLVDAKDNLERSLAYRAVPLGAENYAQALTYRKLLDAQLAHVAITCMEAGAVVTLDGKYLFTAPGTTEQFLLASEHQLAATKPGLRTVVVTFTGVAGRVMPFELRPTPEVRPPHWGYWKHMLGGGGVVVGLGALTYIWASRSFDHYDDLIAANCKPQGCTAEKLRELPEVEAAHTGARTRQTVALSLFGAGGAAIVAGLIGLIVDQPKVRPEAGRAVPAVTPQRGGATVSLGWAF